LNQVGYEAFPALNAEAGLKLIAKTQPQLVIVDLGLPGIDGFEAIQMIIRDFPNTPLVILTGSQNEDFVKKAFELGVCEFISKPVSLEALHKKIIHGIIGDPL
jgi:YesN/AraC family two-component response regulator